MGYNCFLYFCQLNKISQKMAKAKTAKSKATDNKPVSRFIQFWKKKETKIILGIILLSITLYLTIIFFSFILTGNSDFSKVNNVPFSKIKDLDSDILNFGGAFGAWISNILINGWFGIPSVFILVFLWLTSLKLLGVEKINLLKAFILNTIALIWFSIALGFFFKFIYEDTFLYWGGSHGYFLTEMLKVKIGYPGTLILIVATLAIFLVVFKPTGNSLLNKLLNIPKTKKAEPEVEESENYGETPEKKEGEVPEDFETSWTGDLRDDIPFGGIPEEPLIEPEAVTQKDDIPFEIKAGSDSSEPDVEEPEIDRAEIKVSKVNGDDYDASFLGNYNPKLDLSGYKYPHINLLSKYENSETVINTEEQNSNKRRIQEVLEQFSIRISSITATVGATVTLYEIIPEPGIRISKIKNLENDIALSLAALGIRIIAPIPGKGTIGIEVPNRDPQIVSMYNVINSRKFAESKHELPMVMGKTITNDVFMVDLCKMPHVLVAGSTGQGKSVGLNAMITSLLYKKHPAELKFVMIDPKMVEFNIYSVIEKHFLAKLPDDSNAIVTDFTKVIQTLNSLTIEMDDRYKLLMNANVRNIKEYNEKFITRRLNPEKGHKFLPYIVVVIDEFGDLIMTAGKEIEMPIARIAQKARAVGIHMIIATQRPTTNIITGTIKANFPARVAFRVISATDSRTILDASGANQLIGRGDMLFSQGSDLVRVQCAFVDTPEVINVTNFISEQRGYPTPFYLPEPQTDGSGSGNVMADLSDRDPLFEEAARLIVMHQQGSTSLVQRKLSLGYNRAGRIIDQLEAAGIIGPNEGSKARQVLVEDEMQLENIIGRLK